jgi:hypothetical protein
VKVVFVPSPTSAGGIPQTHLPLGLVSLATILKQTPGIEPAIFNLNKRPDFKNRWNRA